MKKSWFSTNISLYRNHDAWNANRKSYMRSIGFQWSWIRIQISTARHFSTLIIFRTDYKIKNPSEIYTENQKDRSASLCFYDRHMQRFFQFLAVLYTLNLWRCIFLQNIGTCFSQPSIYIDGWLYGMRMTSVTFRCCLKTIPHIIILCSRHESDIPSLPGRQVSSS